MTVTATLVQWRTYDKRDAPRRQGDRFGLTAWLDTRDCDSSVASLNREACYAPEV